MSVLSAGLASEAETPLDEELLRWADRVFVMERRHRSAIRRRFGPALADTPLVCLDIPDRYRFMDPALVRILQSRMARYVN